MFHGFKDLGYHVVYHSLSVAFCSLLNVKEKQLLSVKTFTSEKFCDEIQASRLPGMNRQSSNIKSQTLYNSTTTL